MFYLLAALIYIYCSRHRITDFDPFTDDFLIAQGIKVNPKEPEPKDQFGEHRSKVIFLETGSPRAQWLVFTQFVPSLPTFDTFIYYGHELKLSFHMPSKSGIWLLRIGQNIGPF